MKSIKKILFPILLLTFMTTKTNAAGAPQISYNLTFPEAQAHYVDIEMNITGLSQKELSLKMPVWTPGSYMVREFSKNIDKLSRF